MGNDRKPTILHLATPLFRPNGPGRTSWRCTACGQALATDGAEAALTAAAPDGLAVHCPHCGGTNPPPERKRPAGGGD